MKTSDDSAFGRYAKTGADVLHDARGGGRGQRQHAFDAQLAAWLSTARGRFAAWIAERDRLAGEASA